MEVPGSLRHAVLYEPRLVSASLGQRKSFVCTQKGYKRPRASEARDISIRRSYVGVYEVAYDENLLLAQGLLLDFLGRSLCLSVRSRKGTSAREASSLW